MSFYTMLFKVLDQINHRPLSHFEQLSLKRSNVSRRFEGLLKDMLVKMYKNHTLTACPRLSCDPLKTSPQTPRRNSIVWVFLQSRTCWNFLIGTEYFFFSPSDKLVLSLLRLPPDARFYTQWNACFPVLGFLLLHAFSLSLSLSLTHCLTHTHTM